MGGDLDVREAGRQVREDLEFTRDVSGSVRSSERDWFTRFALRTTALRNRSGSPGSASMRVREGRAGTVSAPGAAWRPLRSRRSAARRSLRTRASIIRAAAGSVCGSPSCRATLCRMAASPSSTIGGGVPVGSIAVRSVPVGSITFDARWAIHMSCGRWLAAARRLPSWSEIAPVSGSPRRIATRARAK